MPRGEVRALIAIWGEDKIQEELDGAVRNQAIFDSIARKMQQKGYDRDWQQCRNKIKNLKKEYRLVKDNSGQTGEGEKHASIIRSLMTSQGIGQHQYQQVLTYIKIVPSSTDRDDIHANSPLDSALISQAAEGSQAAGGTQSTTDDKEPGEEAGVGM